MDSKKFCVLDQPEGKMVERRDIIGGGKEVILGLLLFVI